VTDRRGGRIDNETNLRVGRKLQEGIRLHSKVPFFFEPVKEHRALLVLRDERLRDEIEETDPQKTGKPPLPPRAISAEAKESEAILTELVNEAGRILADEEKANMSFSAAMRNTGSFRASRSGSS
jgi:2,3-bisphosphoglycerate-independent phosphoglycerate mutase